MVEKFGIEKFLLALGLKSSWFKNLGLQGLGLKLGVEKSGVEMSFNKKNPSEFDLLKPKIKDYCACEIMDINREKMFVVSKDLFYVLNQKFSSCERILRYLSPVKK